MFCDHRKLVIKKETTFVTVQLAALALHSNGSVHYLRKNNFALVVVVAAAAL